MSATSDRVAVVTGASGGIGLATALKLSHEGYAVIAQYRTRRDAAEALRDRVSSSGGTCWLLQADLSTPVGVHVFAEDVVEILSVHPGVSLRALVNNAARLLGPSFTSASTDEFDTYFAINTRAPFFLTQALSTMMPPGGSIVNISSAGAHFSSPGDIVYAMSKAALESFTKNAAEGLAERGIRINAVIPGFTDNGHAAFNNPDIRAHMASYSVLGGISTPETVAEAIVFLLSDHASRTTGAIFDVSGGSTLGARPRTRNTISLRAASEWSYDATD